MKSGPTLKGCTFRPRWVSAAMSARATVVLPAPLWLPAISRLRRVMRVESLCRQASFDRLMSVEVLIAEPDFHRLAIEDISGEGAEQRFDHRDSLGPVPDLVLEQERNHVGVAVFPQVDLVASL